MHPNPRALTVSMLRAGSDVIVCHGTVFDFPKIFLSMRGLGTTYPNVGEQICGFDCKRLLGARRR